MLALKDRLRLNMLRKFKRNDDEQYSDPTWQILDAIQELIFCSYQQFINLQHFSLETVYHNSPYPFFETYYQQQFLNSSKTFSFLIYFTDLRIESELMIIWVRYLIYFFVSYFYKLEFIHIIRQSRRLAKMNRSHSNSHRSFSSLKQKQTKLNLSVKSQFRTIWKSRNNLLNNDNPNQNQKPVLKTINFSQATNNEYQTAAQQEMKQFIKIMKRASNQTAQSSDHQISQYQGIPTSPSPPLSVRSTTKSRCQSKRENLAESRTQISLNDLEKKIQLLLATRLRTKTSSKSFFSQRILDNELDRELKNLIKEVRTYNNNQLRNSFNSDELSTQIGQISQKIQIIEKAIAESYTQSEMMKKFFFQKQRYRKNYAIADKKPIRRNFSTEKFRFNDSFPSIDFQTINKSSYIAPSKDCYAIKAPQNNSYIGKNQPIPRSMYQRQYLNYGQVPTYPLGSRGGGSLSSQNLNKSAFENRHTSYQLQFKQKQAQVIDSRILDCRKDKYRNVNMSFIPRKDNNFNLIGKNSNLKKIKRKSSVVIEDQINSKKRSIFEHNKITINQKTNEKEQKQNQIPSGKKIKHPIFKTENQYQYRGQKCMVQSKIKQKNLSSLKYSYRFQFQV